MRSYQQYCGVATALDIIGDRWTLLLVRELLDGPKRYTDLLDGLPGISTDILAARIRSLETDGLVERQTLPPPAASNVYVLTEDGATLEPIVLAVARWGIHRLSTDENLVFRPHWFELGLRALYQPTDHDPVTVDFHIGPNQVRALIGNGALRIVDDYSTPPDVAITGQPSAIAALLGDPTVRERAFTQRRVSVKGDDQAIAAVQRAFGLV